jgi:hypothetical protein
LVSIGDICNYGYVAISWRTHNSRIEGFIVARKTLKQFVESVRQFYEQEQGKTNTSTRIGVQVKRWVWWTTAGLSLRAC